MAQQCHNIFSHFSVTNVHDNEFSVWEVCFLVGVNVLQVGAWQREMLLHQSYVCRTHGVKIAVQYQNNYNSNIFFTVNYRSCHNVSASVKQHGWLLSAEDGLCNLLHWLFSFSQVQSIKQNNSSLKQSLNEGVDVFKPAEVSILVQLIFLCFTSFTPLLVLIHMSLISVQFVPHVFLYTLSFSDCLQILFHPLWEWD